MAQFCCTAKALLTRCGQVGRSCSWESACAFLLMSTERGHPVLNGASGNLAPWEPVEEDGGGAGGGGAGAGKGWRRGGTCPGSPGWEARWPDRVPPHAVRCNELRLVCWGWVGVLLLWPDDSLVTHWTGGMRGARGVHIHSAGLMRGCSALVELAARGRGAAAILAAFFL